MEQEQIQITHIGLSYIVESPLNPRKHFDQPSIEELADSIREKGVLQPILVRPDADGYEIVAGARRYRAMKHLYPDLDATIPCIIRQLTDDDAMEIMIIENLQRRDIHPMEEAAGFHQLSQVKHMDAKEIAARVGKSAPYVAQRMKLNDLIEPIQKFFYEGHLHMKDAITISKLIAKDQKELYEDEMENVRGVFELSNYKLRKYQHSLANAPFDITDANLKKDMGPCTTCPFNSAFNTLLFPDMENNPICQNSACFKQKCNLAYTAALDNAKEDPSVVLITGQYAPEKDTVELMKKVEGILTYDSYDEIWKPEYPEREDFFSGLSEEEDEKEFQEAIREYHVDVEKFNKKASSGGYLKAFIVGGNDKGRYTYVKINKGKSKGVMGSTTSSNGSGAQESEIKFEIDRIKSREKRAKELDDVKVWAEIYKLFNPVENIKDLRGSLTQMEITAASHALFNKLTFGGKEEYEKLYRINKKNTIDNHFDCITGIGLTELVRFFILDTLPPSVIYSSITGDSAIMMKLAEEYWPNAVESICMTHKEKADKRTARVESRIKDLQAKLKESKKASGKNSNGDKASAPVPKSTAKKKSIKALVN